LKSGRRLQQLIDVLLDVSRIAAGRLILKRELVDVALLVQEVAARARGAQPTAVVEVDAPDRLEGRFDRQRLEQVVGNLLSNALKYGGARPVHVALAVESDDVVLRVRDEGPGIALADQPRIFERFERAANAVNRAGLGLGLWIAREVVVASGGTITVDSAPGRGAVFTVRLPLAGP
jgi:signal transduction histidine kinase